MIKTDDEQMIEKGFCIVGSRSANRAVPVVGTEVTDCAVGWPQQLSALRTLAYTTNC